MPSLKTTSLCKVLDLESVLEHNFLLLLDHDPNCIDIQPQPIKITYINEKCNEIAFYPDCWSIFLLLLNYKQTNNKCPVRTKISVPKHKLMFIDK